MTMGPEHIGPGPAIQERFAGQFGANMTGGYRGSRREPAPPAESDLPPASNGAGPSLDPLPSLDGLAEPTFPPPGWLDQAEGTLADHPLLRGLLLELPPKGTVPPPGWLDRWFEAARSILELLYVQESPPRTR
jgi:hypothetical protein